ncbi:MAG: hypothetical protein LBV80_01385 [Deltaproteobacteria bacterium]|jgi:hypothetical protein|nr:hypothetical protein [Deltaproteobacteria bacterium]
MLNKLWIYGLCASILVNFALALLLVWSNTERAGLGYELKQQQQAMTELADLTAKLEVERDRLLSPYYLDARAVQFGLRSALPGQKRFMR